MAVITRFMYFTLCLLVVDCRSKHGENTWSAVNRDNRVTITVSNRQHSYANVNTYDSGYTYYGNYIEEQLNKVMQNIRAYLQSDLFSKIYHRNTFSYDFIAPPTNIQFAIQGDGIQSIPSYNPTLYQTPVMVTTAKKPEVQMFTTNKPQTYGNRQFQITNVPILRSQTILPQKPSTAPPPKTTTGPTLRSQTILPQKPSTTTPPPKTTMGQTWNTKNTQILETTTAQPQETTTARVQKDNTELFFDDEDDTTRPIILRDAKSSKNDRALDKKLRIMPEVEHGSVQAGI